MMQRTGNQKYANEIQHSRRENDKHRLENEKAAVSIVLEAFHSYSQIIKICSLYAGAPLSDGATENAGLDNDGPYQNFPRMKHCK